jgi:hypothetical protein
LQLGLQHAPLEMNKMNRSTRAGRRAAVNLCLYPHARRITINPGRMREERP